MKAQLKLAESQLALAESRLARLEQQPRPGELPPSLAKIKTAAANVARLQDQYERSKNLTVTGVINQEEYVIRQQEYEAAVHQHAQAQAEFDLLKAGAWKPDIEIAKAAVTEARPVEHSFEKDPSFLYGVIFTDVPEDPSHHSRNLCVFANAEVDRSPTGTGVAARLAVHHARGEVAVGETITIESILGRHSVFEGRVVEETRFGPYPGIIPEVSGRAFLTGRHEFVLDPDDPLGAGFLL